MEIDEFIMSLQTMRGDNFNSWFLKVIPQLNIDDIDIALHKSHIENEMFNIWKDEPMKRHFYINVKNDNYDVRSTADYDIKPYILISLPTKKLREVKLKKLFK